MIYSSTMVKKSAIASFLNPFLGVWKSDQKFLVYDILLRVLLPTCSLTACSGSTVKAHNAGRTLVAHSFTGVYSSVVHNALIPAIRAGGKGSRKARRNPETITF